MNRSARPWYFWPLIAFIGGLLIGWLLIGWWLWPVEWKNALPQDLAPTYQQQYLTMLAESYAANGNLALAQDRLAGWPSEELQKALVNTQENLAATDPARAGNVQLLASALSVSLAAGEPVAAPTPQVAQPAPAAEGGGSLASTLTTVCTAILWIVLFLAAIVFFGYLFLRWRAAHNGTPPPDLVEWLRSFMPRRGQPAPVERTDYEEYADESAESEGLAERTAEEIAAQEKARWDDTAPTGWREVTPAAGSPARVPPVERPDVLFDADEDSAGEADLPPFMSSRPEVRNVSGLRPPAAEPPAAPVRPGGVADGAKLGVKLGDFVAIYQMGVPDYDEAFDINDPVDGLMGQCGLQLNEPVGRNRDQAVALQVWLWDSSDPDTRIKVLMSEAAYRDTATRAQQVTEHDAVPVRQGSDFELESHDLLLKGRVERVEYAEQEAARAVFADLQVRMQVYRKG